MTPRCPHADTSRSQTSRGWTGPIFTVGHSNRSFPEFLELLRAHSVRFVADVRRFPPSRRHPQFDRDRLASALAEHGIAYWHCPALGGRRQPRPDSPNTAWSDPGFRGFADHMQTAEFAAALDELVDRAEQDGPLALVCAEALPWRCHRSLIADALVARGYTVVHVLAAGRLQLHQLPLFARLDQGSVSYPAGGPGR
ncbi:DUF488 domain-containing protein [Thermomicrobium sp.]